MEKSPRPAWSSDTVVPPPPYFSSNINDEALIPDGVCPSVVSLQESTTAWGRDGGRHHGLLPVPRLGSGSCNLIRLPGHDLKPPADPLGRRRLDQPALQPVFTLLMGEPFDYFSTTTSDWAETAQQSRRLEDLGLLKCTVETRLIHISWIRLLNISFFPPSTSV